MTVLGRVAAALLSTLLTAGHQLVAYVLAHTVLR